MADVQVSCGPTEEEIEARLYISDCWATEPASKVLEMILEQAENAKRSEIVLRVNELIAENAMIIGEMCELGKQLHISASGRLDNEVPSITRLRRMFTKTRKLEDQEAERRVHNLCSRNSHILGEAQQLWVDLMS